MENNNYEFLTIECLDDEDNETVDQLLSTENEYIETDNVVNIDSEENFVDCLILDVQSHDILFDLLHPDYHNQRKKDAVWLKVADNCSRPVSDCKRRWRSLRDRFRSLYNKETNTISGQASTKKIDWWYYNALKFLIPTITQAPLYESAPWSIEAWGRPVESCPLASTRLAGAGNSTTVNSNTVQSTVFCVRCGTPRGVISHWLRAETHRDMASWARALVQGSHNAVNFQREFSFRCLYQGRPSQLIVHLDRGFSLLEGIGPQTKTIWTFPFDKLKGSADDGHRILYLDFGGDENEIEMDMECCPKPVVFVLHNCLSAKVHSLA